ncbi:hypothetical protein V7127_20520 [Bacillus sp. JJ1773]|uniref:hypothetical protein n=1 Tax=Bacillus sp. JJ1773 TaxID=3122965 RepID=UPI002FFE72C3
MIKNNLPILNCNTACIVSNDVDLELISIVSSYLNSKSVYYPMFRMPSVNYTKNEYSTPKDDNYMSNIIAQKAATKILNSISKMNCKTIFVIGLDMVQLSYFRLEQYYKLEIFYINTLDDISKIKEVSVDNNFGVFYCNPANIPEGLFIAKNMNQIVKVDRGAERLNQLLEIGGKGIVIAEKNNDLSDIIITNYAVTINADIKFIEPISEEDIDDFNRNLIHWKRNRSYGGYIKVSDYINKALGDIDFEKYQYATFFTDGIPYGVLFNDLTCCTHVLRSINEDLFIFNNIYYEFSKRMFDSALLFSPEPNDLGASVVEETNIIDSILKENNFNVKSIRNYQATVKAFDQNVSYYPYDLLHVVSHGGETNGYYVEQEFIDRNGKKHIVEYEEVAGFAKEDTEFFKVVSKKIFKFLDGAKWKSKELDDKRYPQYVYDDMLKSITADEDKINITRTKVDYLVEKSCHIQCFDSIHQGQFHTVASNTTPIIFNNTCTSWKEFSTQIIAAGCRGYIGTLWNIGNDEAFKAAKFFYTNVFNKTIASNVNNMLRIIENENYKDIYIFCGLHFSTISRPKVKSKDKVIDELIESLKRWNLYISKPKEKTLLINAVGNIKFICSQLAPFYNYKDVTELIIASIINSNLVESLINNELKNNDILVGHSN